MQRRVRVGAAHRLLVSRNDVIVIVPVFIVPHSSAAGDLFDHFQGDMLALCLLRRGRHGKIEAAQRLAQVTARALGEIGTGLGIHRDRHALRLRELFQRVVQPLLHIRRRQGFELEHRAAGQQRIIDVKIRVLGRGGDEGHAAVLDALQQALLLLFVQVLDLVQIEQDAPRPGQRADVLEHGLDVAGAAGGAVELVEGHAAVLRNDAGHGGLAGAGGAVEDHVGDAAALDGAAEHPPRPQTSASVLGRKRCASGSFIGDSSFCHLRQFPD